MAYSSVTYTGNGVQTQFSVTFPFISQSDVTATVAGVTTAFTWVNATTIQFAAAPASGAAVVLSRSTPVTTPNVAYSDRALLTASNLNTSLTQLLYGMQEIKDGLGVPVAPAVDLPEYYASSYGVSALATAAANTAALNACIADVEAQNGGRIILPHGTIQCNALAPFGATSSATVIRGQGRYGSSCLSFANATGDCITINGGGGQCGIENLCITAHVRRTADYAIKITGSAFTPYVRDVFIVGHYNGIWVDYAGEVEIQAVQFRYMTGHRGILIGGGATSRVYRTVLRDIRTDNPPVHGTDGVVKTYAASTHFDLGDIVDVNGSIWVCGQAGTTGASSSPSVIPGSSGYDYINLTVTDGTVEWEFAYKNDLIWVAIDSYAYSTVGFGLALVNGANGVYVADGQNVGGVFPSHPIWTWFDDLESDHAFYGNVVLDKGEGFTLQRSWLGSARNNNGLHLSAGFMGEVKIMHTRIAGAGYHGILWYPGPADVTIAHCMIGYNSTLSYGASHGIYINAGTVAGTITGCTIGLIAYSKWSLVSTPMGYGIYLAAGATDNLIITDNDLRGNATGGLFNGATGTNIIIRDNLGYKTRNKGSSTIASGTTSKTVTHGLDYTPAPQDVSILFTQQGTNDYGRWWVDTINATTFNVHVSADPGAPDLQFAWAVER